MMKYIESFLYGQKIKKALPINNRSKGRHDFKSILSRLLCAVMLTAQVLPLAGYPTVGYAQDLITKTEGISGLKDLKGHWAESVVQQWVNNRKVNGYPDGTFKPDQLVSRAEFMALVNNSLNLVQKSTLNFKDLNRKHWSYEVIEKAVAAGYIGGYPDGTVKPDAPISRQEAAVILTKAGKLDPYLGEALSGTAVSGNRFKDETLMAPWARVAVSAATGQNLLKGYPDGTFRPEAKISRSEAVVGLQNVLTAIEELQPKRYGKGGTYGSENPLRPEIIRGDVYIEADGVTLNNLSIGGKLIISESVKEGTVTLNRVSVAKDLIVRGGGKNSVYLSGGIYSRIVIEQTSSDTVRIVAKDINGLDILVSESAAGEGVILEGNFDEIRLSASSVKIKSQGNTLIQSMILENSAKNNEVTLGDKTEVVQMTFNVPTAVKGQGIIRAADVRVDGITYEKAPEKQIVSSTVTIIPVVTPPAEQTVILPPMISVPFVTPIPSPPSGGGDPTPPPPTTIAVTGITLSPTSLNLLIGEQASLTATVQPNNATNMGVQWTSSTPAVATVSGGGITAVSAGTTTITATASGDVSRTATALVTVTAPVVLSSAKEVLSFSLPGQTGPALLNSENGTINVEIAYGPTPTAVVATFTLSQGATAKVGIVNQASGVTVNNFSVPVVYAVQAENGSVKNWTVTVTMAAPLPVITTVESGDRLAIINWEPVYGAQSYKVYQATSLQGTYTEIGNNVVATNFTAANLTPGKVYYFKVQSVENDLASQFSSALSIVSNIDANGNVYMGDKLLVSNESANSSVKQPSGNLDIRAASQVVLPLGAYRMDPVMNEDLGPKLTDGIAPMMRSFLGGEDIQSYVINDTRNFYVYDFVNRIFVQIAARLAYVGASAEVWVEANPTTVLLDNAQAALIGQEFENQIQPLLTDQFGLASDVNNDGKIAIFCYDIQDGFAGPGSGYVGGYFRGGDLTNSASTNAMEIFYMDTWPSMGMDPLAPDVSEIYSILAHEYQHMVNFNQNYFVEGDNSMDDWLDESLSMAAEHLYLNQAMTSRISYYNISPSVRDGRSLLDWNDYETLANYSLSYLFGQYLRTRIDQAQIATANTRIYKELIQSDFENYSAVEALIKLYVDPNLTFGQFMTQFRAAMVLKASEGPYGFNGEAAFNALNTPVYSGGALELSGGGAVIMNNDADGYLKTTGQGPQIQYLGIFE